MSEDNQRFSRSEENEPENAIVATESRYKNLKILGLALSPFIVAITFILYLNRELFQNTGLLFLIFVVIPIIVLIFKFNPFKGMPIGTARMLFDNIGEVRGRTKSQIIAVVGQPKSVSSIGPDQTLLQWQSHGYHIALHFSGDVCIGITHEYNALKVNRQ